MSEAIIIWLYLSLGKVVMFFSTALGLLAIGLLCYGAIACMRYADGFGDDREEVVKEIALIKKYTPIKTLIFISIICFFYPSKDDLKYIIGGAAVWNGIEAAQDIEGVETLPANIVGAMNHFLEKTQEKK